MFIRPPKMPLANGPLLKHAMKMGFAASERSMAVGLLMDAYLLDLRSPAHGCDLVVEEAWIDGWKDKLLRRFSDAQFKVLEQGDTRIYLLPDMTCVIARREGSRDLRLSLVPGDMNHAVDQPEGPRFRLVARQSEGGRGSLNVSGIVTIDRPALVDLRWETWITGHRDEPPLNSFPERRDMLFDSALDVAETWFDGLSQMEISPGRLPAALSTRVWSAARRDAIRHKLRTFADATLLLNGSQEEHRAFIGCMTIVNHGQRPSQIFIKLGTDTITFKSARQADEAMRIHGATPASSVADAHSYRLMNREEALTDERGDLFVVRHRWNVEGISEQERLALLPSQL